MRTPCLVLLIAACSGGDAPDSGDSGQDTSIATYDDDLGLDCGLVAVPLPAHPTPVVSFGQLPTSNGWVSATWASAAYGVPVTFADGSSGTVDQLHRLATFTDHTFRQPTPETWTRDLLWDLYLGVRVDGVSTWLDTVAEQRSGYESGTGIIEVVQVVGDIEITTRVFAPFQDGGTRDLVVVGSVRNTGTTAHDVTLFSLQNAHTGGEGRADREALTASAASIVERRDGDAIAHTPLDPPTATAGAPAGHGSNPWVKVTSGGDLDGTLASGDDVAVGFQWSLGTVAPGTQAVRGLVLSHGTDATALPARVAAFVRGRDSAAVLADERADWASFHADEDVPEGLSADEEAVFRQSTAVLRMGQVREQGPGYGQILASLPPGGWNMSWPRDAAYAIVGLVHAGHRGMARDALAFQIASDSGYYADYLGIDDYLISAARYYGNGREESDDAWCPDGTSAGPNVELDDFGLFLWAYGEYARRWPDDPWVAQTLATVLAGVADPLVELIDPANNLLVADSSIWERHWEECFPNGRKQFTYSSLQAVAGLRVAAELSGDAVYSNAADTLRTGLLGLRTEGGPVLTYPAPDGTTCPLLASSPEEICEGCGPYDGSVIDLINHGIVRPDSAMAIGTLTGLQGALRMGNGSPGFLRNDDGTGSTNPYPWYDDQEWVVIDLRMAAAYARVGTATGDPVLQANARVLVDWITAQARANADLIPELLSDGVYTGEDEHDRFRPGFDVGSEFQGAIPMCGFGPGAYILALEAIYAP